MKHFFGYLCVYLLILLNKSVIVVLKKEILTLLVFVFLIIYVVINKVQLLLVLRDLLKLLFLFSLMFGQILITNYSLDLETIIRYFVIFLATYLGINFIEGFREKFVEIVAFLSVCSLIFFFFQSIGFLFFENIALDYGLPQIYSYKSGGLIYVFGNNSHYDRNCGIFPEPGVYQITLNFALLLVLFYDVKIKKKLKTAITLILIITIISALSTAGIIMLVIQLLGWAYKEKKFNIKTITLMLIVFTVIFIFIRPYTVEKFTYNEVTGRFENTSTEVRFNDIITDYNIFVENPMGVGYAKYHNIFQDNRLGIGEGESSSSGLTSLFAIFGFAIGLLYLLTVIRNIVTSRNGNIEKLELFAFFLIVGLTQPAMFLPLMVSMFYSSNKIIYENDKKKDKPYESCNY